MGIFSTSSPFDADVEKATNENNTSEEWGLIMEICDKVGNSPANAKDCLRSILRRLHNPDPHIVLQAITLLDACVKNCGKVFQLEIASRDFEAELRKLVTGRSGQGKVGERLRGLIKKWAENEFKNDPQLGLIPSLYSKLKQEGADFSNTPEHTSRPTRTGPVDPDAVSSQEEVDDIAKAIELSLKEAPKTSRSSGGGTGGLYPSVGAGTSSASTSNMSSVPEPRRVRALYDFEAAEDNELTFFAGEIIHVTDDSDANWWRGCNQRGEGLFPANFVTSDLSVDPEKLKTEKKGVQFNETVEVKTIKAPQQIEIDEAKIDRLMNLLHEADPNDGRQDSEEMLMLEEEVNGMGPLIDAELERVDRKHAQLTQLSSGLVDALNLYHTLMREPFHSPPPKPPPHHAYHPMYNGVGGGFPMPPPEHYMMPPPPQFPPHAPRPEDAPPPMPPYNGMYGGGMGPGAPPPQQQFPPQPPHNHQL